MASVASTAINLYEITEHVSTPWDLWLIVFAVLSVITLGLAVGLPDDFFYVRVRATCAAVFLGCLIMVFALMAVIEGIDKEHQSARCATRP